MALSLAVSLLGVLASIAERVRRSGSWAVVAVAVGLSVVVARPAVAAEVSDSAKAEDLIRQANEFRRNHNDAKALPLFLALISWATFNIVGIVRHGFVGYFKQMCFPPGVPKLVYVLLAPIEFLSTFIIRPITLTLRLTLNMFAGHLVLLVCILGGEYLLVEKGWPLALFSPVAFGFGIVLTFFEGFIQLLQAYVFTLLSALYIAGAMAEEH